ncbi:MAG: hypothetical protein ABSG86_08980 [Thermoguttaceae bacterium]
MSEVLRIKLRQMCLVAIAVGPFFAAVTAVDSETAKPAGVPAGAADILGLESYWRWFISLRKPIIPAASLRAAGQEAAGPRLLTGREVPPPYSEVDHQDSPPPPAGWEQSGFEDFGWPRSRLSLPTGSSASGRGPTTTGSRATKAWCRSAGTGTRA